MEQILIVEDDTDINNMMASALTKAGYECKQSFSGTEAMLYLNKEKFSVIILDLMLPGKSGNSIVEEIKPYLDTSIIVVSAKDELDTKVNLLFSGADDYITKPFEIDELSIIRKCRASFYGKRRLIIPESPSYRNNHVDPDGKFKWAYDAEERYMRKEVKRWRLRVSFW